MSRGAPLLPFPPGYPAMLCFAANPFMYGDPFVVQRAFLCSPAGMQLLQNRLYNGTVVRGTVVRGTVVRGAAASVQANLVTIVPPAIKMPQKIAPKSQNVKKLRVETDNERDNREYSEWTKRSGRKPRLMPRSMLARCVDV